MKDSPLQDLPSTAATTKPRKVVELRYVLMPFAIIFAAIIVLMAFSAMAPKPEKKTNISKAPLVETQVLQASTVNFAIHSQGTVQPRTETILISEVSGVIKRVSDKFVAGGYFKQGELMLEIDPISYEVALLQAQARLDAANAKLIEEKARSKQAEHEWRMTGKALDEAPILALRTPLLQQAQADVKAAQADVKNAQIKLARTKIIAPYDAMVKQKIADVGQYVSTGSQLAITFAIDYAEVRLPIKSRDLPYIQVPRVTDDKQTKEGALVHLSQSLSNSPSASDNNLLHSWETRISRSEGVVDSRSRVNYLITTIDDPYNIQNNSDKATVRIGTFVNANIRGSDIDNIFMLPRASIRGADKVYLLNTDNTLSTTTVDILHSDSRYIYVRGGLENGQRLITTNVQTPVNGMKLRTLEDSASPVSQETEKLESSANEQTL